MTHDINITPATGPSRTVAFTPEGTDRLLAAIRRVSEIDALIAMFDDGPTTAERDLALCHKLLPLLRETSTPCVDEDLALGLVDATIAYHAALSDTCNTPLEYVERRMGEDAVFAEQFGESSWVARLDAAELALSGLEA
jgi:hypothetical protein